VQGFLVREQAGDERRGQGACRRRRFGTGRGDQLTDQPAGRPGCHGLPAGTAGPAWLL